MCHTRQAGRYGCDCARARGECEISLLAGTGCQNTRMNANDCLCTCGFLSVAVLIWFYASYSYVCTTDSDACGYDHSYACASHSLFLFQSVRRTICLSYFCNIITKFKCPCSSELLMRCAEHADPRHSRVFVFTAASCACSV